MKTKNSKWFSHDSDTTGNPKIIELISREGMAGYGRWWRLLELLRDADGYHYDIQTQFAYSAIAKELKTSVPKTKQFITDCIEYYGLLKTDGSTIWSASLIDRMDYWEKKREVLSERGKRGAASMHAKRIAQACKNDDVSMQLPCNEMANETKLNETKQNNKEEEVIPPTPPTTNFLGSEAILPIATLQQNVMKDEIYFVTPICMQFGIEPAKVNDWLTAFNRHLGAEEQLYKTSRDYRKHFLHWLKYQDVTTADPTNWKPVTKARQKSNSSPPPQPTAEEVLAQREAEKEYYRELNKQPKQR